MDKETDSSVLKEGFLVKRGHVVHNWKARWFVLYPDSLIYYKYDGTKKDSSQRGKITLPGCVVTCPYLEYENRPLVLRLQTQNSAEYFLEACSREDRDEWAASIISAVQKLRPPDGQSQSAVSKGPKTLQLHNISLNQVVDSMYDVYNGIKLTNHAEQGSSYSNCFSGSAVVDWLLSMQLVLTRVEAVTLASALLEEGFVRPVGLKSVEAVHSSGLNEQFLDDSTALYSFAETFKKRGSVKADTSLTGMEMSGKVLKRGFLLKQGHKRKNWKVRLFVLRAEPGYLHYYDPSKDDINPAGGFSLRGCLVSALDDNGIPSGVKGKVQGNLFKIITQSNTRYFIQAPTRQEKTEWIEAIKQQT
ncbi:pleckstrin-2 [Brienomyrus brachyistius]|uniref:pleckstrin-2 n=1 Tax=Brienomyrus brachyistius TaxID=42636 RepID=UPI0020B264BF|nr:pleckstrin-2 [Brienomyrus brachyistius]